MLNRGHAEPGTTLWPMAKLTPFAEYWSVLRVPAPSAREALSRVARASWAGAASGEHSSTKVVTRASTLPISGLLAVGEPGANRRGGHGGGHPRGGATAGETRTGGRRGRGGAERGLGFGRVFGLLVIPDDGDHLVPGRGQEHARQLLGAG